MRATIEDDPTVLVERAVHRRDVKFLAFAFFGIHLTTGQVRIARAVAFRESRRIIINAHTRYGKTYAVAVGVCLLILLDRRPLKIKFIGPTREQASIIREYVTDLILACRPLQDLLDMGATGARALKKEVSKKRFTFRDGKEIRVMTAEGSGRGLMGFGGDVIIADESVLYTAAAWAKVSRMLAESPDAMLVEMSNPWHAENHYHKHWTSPRYLKIHIGWRQGVEEGRISLGFVLEQRDEELTATEFEILWESRFPRAAKDQLISWAWIKRAEATELPTEAGPWTDQYGLDVASGGTDRTVLTKLRTADLVGNAGKFLDVEWQKEWDYEDTTETTHRVSLEVPAGATIVVDANGVGKGVADQLRRHPNAYRIIALMTGSRARDPKRYVNAKAEVFWDTRRSFEKNLVRIQSRTAPKLARQLACYRFKTRSGRIQVWEETSKSPDSGDSFAYAAHGRHDAGPGRVIREGKRMTPKKFNPFTDGA